jgi:hypothetical protein
MRGTTLVHMNLMCSLSLTRNTESPTDFRVSSPECRFLMHAFSALTIPLSLDKMQEEFLLH